MILGFSTGKGCGSQEPFEDRGSNGQFLESETDTFQKCLVAVLVKIAATRDAGEICSPNAIEDVCYVTCNGYFATQCYSMDWEYYCQGGFLRYSCGNDAPLVMNTFDNYGKICDGYFDCAGKEDEKNCSNRFYCLNGYESVHKSKVCDAAPDCSDVSDECQGCQKEGISTDKEFIGSFFLRWFTVFQCIAILGLNGKALVEHGAAKKKTKVGKIDQVLCVSMTCYDLIMGVYLAIIVVHSISYHGSYCIHDLGWRSSLTCKITGVLFSISTQGSLLTAMMMSVTRCYTCLKPFSDQSFSKIIIALVSVLSTSCVSCVLPILPINLVQNYIQMTMFFKNNPIVARANATMLAAILSRYKGGEVEGLTRSNLVTQLQNTTSDKELFKVSHSLGYYSQSPLCININTSNDGLWVLKIMSALLILAIIGIVSLSYILIAVKSNRPVMAAENQIQHNHLQNKERMNFMSFKVTVIIIAQMSCWVPVLIAILLSLFQIRINSFFYEIAAIVILPLNSILDPILYTSVLKYLVTLLRNRVKQARSNNVEMNDMAPQGGPSIEVAELPGRKIGGGAPSE